MEIYAIILLSIGLATDAFAVSVTHGAAATKFSWTETLKTAFIFGLFQGGMPLLGWLVGISFKGAIASVDHWVAFGLLSLIGIRMIYQDWKDELNSEQKIEERMKSFWTLIALAIATSIDALVAGISFIVLDSIVWPVLSIGLITFILCVTGAYLGHRFKYLAGKKINSIGGGILILIGLKILVEHLSA